MSDDAHVTPAPEGNALSFIAQAWLVITLALVFGAGLTALGLSLKKRINDNIRNEALDQARVLVPGADRGVPDTVAGRDVIRAVAADGTTVGWLVEGEGIGFADAIKVLVAVDAAAERYLGLFVLQQNETPALGNKIKERKWRAQFSDAEEHPMRTDQPVGAYKYGSEPAPVANRVEAVSAATISSDSVCAIVNATMTDELAAALRAAAQEGGDHAE